MKKSIILSFSFILLFGCSSPVTPDNTKWTDYDTKKFNDQYCINQEICNCMFQKN